MTRARIKDGVSNKDKTHCCHGHEFTPENTYAYAPGRRSCRRCSALYRQSMAADPNNQFPTERDRRRLRTSYREDENGCWVWQLHIDSFGYGQYNGIDKRSRRAHRAVWLAFVGEIPHGLDLDHLCRVRACVNPRHLEPVTRGENLRRGYAARARERAAAAARDCSDQPSRAAVGHDADSRRLVVPAPLPEPLR